jgi:hypothetical protein
MSKEDIIHKEEAQKQATADKAAADKAAADKVAADKAAADKVAADKAAADKAEKGTEEAKAQNNPFASGVKKGKSKIIFLKSPTGVFNLGYSEGDACTIDKKQAEILIDAGYAKKA